MKKSAKNDGDGFTTYMNIDSKEVNAARGDTRRVQSLLEKLLVNVSIWSVLFGFKKMVDPAEIQNEVEKELVGTCVLGVPTLARVDRDASGHPLRLYDLLEFVVNGNKRFSARSLSFFVRRMTQRCASRLAKRQVRRRSALEASIRREYPSSADFDFRQREALLAAIHELPESLREIVQAFYFDGLTQQQIADMFETTRDKVQGAITRAKDCLRRSMQDDER
jgi:RNA polymerase sigma factor (sigma-70 family)